MKLAVMTMSFSREVRAGEMSLADIMAYCAELGLDGVEIADREIADMSNGEVLDLLQKHRLQLASYIVITDFVSEDDEVWAQAVAKVKGEIDRAARLGGKTVMIVPGNPKETVSDPRGRELIGKGLEKCAEYGRGRGVVVTNENFGMAIEFRGRVRHMQEFLTLAPACRLTYDGGNFLLAGEDPLEALALLYDDITHVHLKDWVVTDEEGRFPVPGRSGQFYRPAIVGEGVMPTADTVAALKERRYQGYLSIEHGGQIPGKEGLARAVAGLRRLL